MLPLKDENPTDSTPIATVVILVLCALVYFGWQGSSPREIRRDTPVGTVTIGHGAGFTFEHAAIPCEIITGEPLSVAELGGTIQGNGIGCLRGESSPPVFPDKSVWRASVVSMFLHGGLFHLGGNLLFLWIFGNNIEDRLGTLRYVVFYLCGGVAATVAHVAMDPGSTVPVVGASGAIAALMGAYLVWFPQAPIRTAIFLFFIRDITAKWFLGIWFVLQFFTASGSGVAWMAHVGGFVFGVAVGLVVRGSDRGRGLAFRQAELTAGPWNPTGGAGRGPYPHPFETHRPPPPFRR